MKYLNRRSLMLAFAMLYLVGASSTQYLTGQEKKSKKDQRTRAEIELAEELEIERRQLEDLHAHLKAQQKQAEAKRLGQLAKEKAKLGKLKQLPGVKGKGSITINGQKIEIDGKDIEALLHAHGKELHEWAENHAGEWEKWAEKFESKMENFAKHQEAHWEKWAEQYSKRWEDWGEKIESGEIKGDEIGELVERNLKMLSDMPLGDLIDGALKEGMGELKNAPWESLGELHEMVGGSLEQAIREMEKEIASTTKQEVEKALSGKTEDIRMTIKKLQDAISAQGKKIDDDANTRITRLKDMLADQAKSGKVSNETVKELLKAVSAQSAAKQKANDHLRAHSDAIRKKLMEQIHGAKKASAAKELARAKEMEALAAARKAQKMADELSAAKAMESYLAKVKSDAEKMKSKESQIDAMRREIDALRKEVDRLKKDRR